MNIIYISLLLTLFTIPIHTKISIPKLPERVTSVFKRNKDEITHHEFNNVSKLEIANPYGNIEIETWTQPCVLIEVRKKGSAQFLQTSTLKTQKKDGTLYAQTYIDKDSGKGTLNVHVLVPNNLPLKLTTTHGTINIKAHNGAMDLATQWGNITVKDGTHTVLAKTVQGQITVQRKKMQQGHALNLQADHGSIRLQIPQEFEADLQAHTQHGKILSELFISLHPQTIMINEETFKNMKHHIHGWVGQPKECANPTTILLQTNYGLIEIVPYNFKPNSKKHKKS